jgi:hypothetical protein
MSRHYQRLRLQANLEQHREVVTSNLLRMQELEHREARLVQIADAGAALAMNRQWQVEALASASPQPRRKR